MASIRNLKKNLNYLTRELITECLTYRHFHPDIKEEHFEKAVTGIINNHNDLITRCAQFNREMGNKVVKSHFKSICKDFEKSLESLENLDKK
jgi:hypothetical protein